jgi:hypothetical protein
VIGPFWFFHAALPAALRRTPCRPDFQASTPLARLAQTNAGSGGAISIGAAEMSIGFSCEFMRRLPAVEQTMIARHSS